jgi:XTP/dITP diphosphohydrolase
VRVVLATSNAGKKREAARILAGSELEIVTEPIWLGEIETGTTFRENAFIKASSAARLLVHAAVLAEDSGLEVDALAGLPGLHSARFAGPNAHDSDNTAKLLELLSDVSDERRSARYRAVAVLILPSGAEIVGEGTFEGSIAREPRGERGFGYDPVFIPASPLGESRTSAELSDDEKDRLSHRAQSLRAVLSQAKQIGLTRTAVR